jgi:hypothetical protein
LQRDGQRGHLLVDGVVFATEYMRIPVEATTADDVVIEAKRAATTRSCSRGEIDDAEHLGEGIYRLKSGEELRFLSARRSTNAKSKVPVGRFAPCSAIGARIAAARVL